MKKIIIALLMCSLSSSIISYAQTSNYTKKWWTAVAVKLRDDDTSTEFKECNVKILQDEHIVKIFREKTLIYVNTEKETFEYKNDVTFRTRKCIDEYGEKCILSFLQKNNGTTILLIEYDELTICFGIIPD